MGNKESRVAWLLAVATLTFGTLLGCSGPKGDPGRNATAPDGGGCSVADNGDGTSTVSCADGTSVTISNGQSGEAGKTGTNCTATQFDGGITLTCGDASTTIYNNAGQPGQPGLNAGQTPGLTVTASASAPANGKFYAQGEKIVYTATLTTAAGAPVSLGYFSTAALYMNGPRDVLKDKTAVKLLGCSTDRSAHPHHYLDLAASPAPAGLVVSGNKVTFTTAAITDEDPGTYTFGLRLVPKDFPFDATFDLTDVQIKTETAEPLIVGVDKADGTGSCADCHLGAANGKEYMHHIDPGYSPTGSPDLDSVPTRTCLMCHNEDGYAAIQVCADGTKASGGKCADSSTPTYMPDPIVRRVHGVHMGENLLSALDTGATGDFEAYAGLAFPADIKNCQKCHNNTDPGGDTWKTKLSREACGACHDNIDWATGNMVPPRPTSVKCTQDSDCNSLNSYEKPTCNTTTGYCEYTKHGGGPQTDDAQCSTVCHKANGLAPSVEEAHKIAPLAVAYTVDISMTAPTNGTDYEGSEAPKVTITLKDATSGATVDPTANMPKAAQFFVSGPREDTMPVLTTAAANIDPTQHYIYNDLTASGDTNLTVTSSGFEYQLASVSGLKPGTYTVFARFQKASEARSFAVLNFQVGTATEEPMIATNCTSCHEDTRMHGYAPFNPDICKNCHDYQAQGTPPDLGWTTGNRNGFGTTPLSRRVHGVHFGKYLSNPTQNTSGIEDIVFPQDVRNCTKCHATSDDWKTEPSRLACLACHDSDADQAHGTLMTVDPTPGQPYSGDEVESCKSCHGPGAEFSVENVHNISDPYAPPYPR